MSGNSGSNEPNAGQKKYAATMLWLRGHTGPQNHYRRSRLISGSNCLFSTTLLTDPALPLSSPDRLAFARKPFIPDSKQPPPVWPIIHPETNKMELEAFSQRCIQAPWVGGLSWGTTRLRLNLGATMDYTPTQ